MTISPSGLVSWKPKEAQKGSQTVRIQVNDGFDAATQTFDIEVTEKPFIPGTDNTVLTLILIVLIVARPESAGTSTPQAPARKLLQQRWPEMPKKSEGRPDDNALPRTRRATPP